jgi:hypothetical protein
MTLKLGFSAAPDRRDDNDEDRYVKQQERDRLFIG